MIPSRWRPYVVACAANSVPERVFLDANDLIRSERREKERKREKRAPRVTSERNARQERSDRLAILRAVLLDETGSTCAICPRILTLDTMELHHLVSGGLRRHRERKETCAPLCKPCHTGEGHNNEATMRALLAWCVETGRQEGARELTRRLDAIAAKRAAKETT